MVREGEEEVARLSDLRDHVKAFADGKISLEAFLAGPDGDEDGDENGEIQLVHLGELLGFVVVEEERARPRRGNARGKPAKRLKRRPRGR